MGIRFIDLHLYLHLLILTDFFEEVLLGPRTCSNLRFYFSRHSGYQTRPGLCKSQVSLQRNKNLFLSDRIKAANKHTRDALRRFLYKEAKERKNIRTLDFLLSILSEINNNYNDKAPVFDHLHIVIT